MPQVNKRLTSKVSHLERSVILQEAYSKRHNIIIEGLPEAQGEDTELRAVHLMADTMKLPISKKDIDKCHRFGRSVNNRPKPIIVRCIMHSTRDKVLQAARKSTHKPEGQFHPCYFLRFTHWMFAIILTGTYVCAFHTGILVLSCWDCFSHKHYD